MEPGQGLMELIFQQDKRCDAVQLAGGQGAGQDRRHPALARFASSALWHAGSCRLPSRCALAQVLQLLLPCLAGGAIAEHQRGQRVCWCQRSSWVSVSSASTTRASLISPWLQSASTRPHLLRPGSTAATMPTRGGEVVQLRRSLMRSWGMVPTGSIRTTTGSAVSLRWLAITPVRRERGTTQQGAAELVQGIGIELQALHQRPASLGFTRADASSRLRRLRTASLLVSSVPVRFGPSTASRCTTVVFGLTSGKA